MTKQFNEKFKKRLLSIGAILIILGIWYAIAGISWFSRGVDFPTPHHTFLSLFDKLAGEKMLDYSIYEHAFTSISRWLTAYIIAIITGILIGAAVGLSEKLNVLFMPFIYTMQLIPGLAWIPVSLLLFGIGNTGTLFMIYMLAVVPVIITTATGIKDTPENLINTAVLMGANKVDLFLHVLLPASLLHIVNGMRMGLANSWRVLIAAEMIVGSGVGLGYIIIQSRWSLDYTSAFVSLILIVAVGLTFEKMVFGRIEKSLQRKYQQQNKELNQISD